jgi:hypothetical protein
MNCADLRGFVYPGREEGWTIVPIMQGDVLRFICEARHLDHYAGLLRPIKMHLNDLPRFLK